MFFRISKLNFIILFTIACTTNLFPQKISLDSLIQIHQNNPQNEKTLIEMCKASKAIGKPNATSKIVDHILEDKL